MNASSMESCSTTSTCLPITSNTRRDAAAYTGRRGETSTALLPTRRAARCVGIAERADRLVAALVTTGLVGLGLPEVVLKVVLAVLAVASVITILQRVLFVRQQVLAEEAADSTPATS